MNVAQDGKGMSMEDQQNAEMPRFYGRWLMLAALMSVGAVWADWQAWRDIFRIAWRDEESSHILLVPVVLAWIFWTYRRSLFPQQIAPSLLGCLVLLLGAGLNYYGYRHSIQSVWHLSAVLLVLGAFTAGAGWRWMWRAWPALLLLLFLVPVPGRVRLEIAVPMQEITAGLTSMFAQICGMDVVRSGSVLTYNGVDVGIAEACNGMRLIFALALIGFAYAFTHPYRAWYRLVILVAVVPLAVISNLLRLLPTLYAYGAWGSDGGDFVHDIAGWLMLGVAYLLLMALSWLMRFLELPIDGRMKVPSSSVQEGADAGQWRRLGVVLAAGVVILVTGLSTLARPVAEDAEPYHRHIRETLAEMSQEIPGWEGRDIPIPESAIQMLRPNAVVSRHYQNRETGVGASFLVVQCRDARDSAGHYPPRCYPAVGWSAAGQERRTWQILGREVEGWEYRYEMTRGLRTEYLFVQHFMVLPGNQTAADMDAVYRLASSYHQHMFGAAQVQVVFPEGTSPEVRHQTLETLVQAHEPLLLSIMQDAE